MSVPIDKKGKPKQTTTITGKNYDEFFQNRLVVPKAILDEMESHNLDHRWIDIKRYQEEGNFHRTHWKPYKVSDATTKKVELDPFGSDNSGYLRRGSLVLAARHKDITAVHKDFIHKRNLRQSAFSKEKAEELRSLFKAAGVKTKVVEGYDDDGQ